MLICGAYILLKSWNTAFLGNFQKPPGGWWTPARRLICSALFWGSGKGTAWRHTPGRQATLRVYTNFWVCGWNAWRGWL